MRRYLLLSLWFLSMNALAQQPSYKTGWSATFVEDPITDKIQCRTIGFTSIIDPASRAYLHGAIVFTMTEDRTSFLPSAYDITTGKLKKIPAGTTVTYRVDRNLALTSPYNQRTTLTMKVEDEIFRQLLIPGAQRLFVRINTKPAIDIPFFDISKMAEETMSCGDQIYHATHDVS